MLLDLIRSVRGTVDFQITGRFPERFINITARNSVHLWNVVRQGDEISASMYRRDYRRVRRLRRGAGVRLRVMKKRGLPVFLRKHRDRVGVLIGAAAFLFAISVMSLFVWTIEITGLETVSESGMRSLLRENGLYVGAFKPTLDAVDLSRSVMLDDSRIGWMAVNITGSYASVELKEESSAPNVDDIHTPTNVKAKRDGVIIRIDTEEGEEVISDGSGVVAGQLIVGGVLEDQQGGVRLVRAKASVLAETTYSAEFRLSREGEGLLPTGEVQERLSVNLFGLELPLTMAYPKAQDALADRIEEAPAPLDTPLPVTLVTEKLYGLKRQPERHSREEAQAILSAEARLYETFALINCTVTDRGFRMSESGGAYRLSAEWKCIEDIAVQEEIGVDRSEE